MRIRGRRISNERKSENYGRMRREKVNGMKEIRILRLRRMRRMKFK